ncbi:MAG: NAD-dependent epimerase/dehydratase family protein [Rhizomicrobium sp.]
MPEAVLVTGGTGFIGGWCIVELLKRGYRVRTTVRDLARAPAVRAAVVAADPGDRLTIVAADLTRDAGWDEAVAGCDHVLHVASPLGVDAPKDPNELIVPARDGALRVLRASVRAGVKRVVLTSSTAASTAAPRAPDSVADETVWTDPNAPGITAYRQSKIYAERAAWEFIRTDGGATSLTTVLPGAVLGPVLSAEGLGSVQIVQRLLKGALPGIPHFGFNVVDVRDVADLHIRAMTAPEAAGQRFIASGEYLWMADVANILRQNLGVRAAKVPTRRLPSILLRLASLFDKTLTQVTPMLDHRHETTSAKAQRVLGWSPRPARETIVDCAESLIARGAA